MPIIDAHVHLYPPEVEADPNGWAQACGERHWQLLCTRRRRDGRPVQAFPSLETLLFTMDAAGVDRAVLLGWYWENPATCVWQNSFYAQCVRQHPDRLSAFASIHPGSGLHSALAEVRRAHDAGLVGLGELSPHSQGFSVSDPVFQGVLDLAGDLGMPVNLHVTDAESRPFPGRIETPANDFLGLLRSFPRTQFILAHWGGMFPLRDQRFSGFQNVFYDTAASPLLYDASVWSKLVPAIGADRVLFGSDYPLNLYPRLDEVPALDRFVREALGAAATPAVMGENAARLLGL